jgi:hypothetical protein
VELALAISLLTAILAAHALPLRRAAPLTAAAVWLLALALRALVAVGGAIYVFLYLPQTEVFDAAVAWCWHELLPAVGGELWLSEHPVGHTLVALPAVALVGSLLWLLFGLMRGWLGLRRIFAGASARGPHGSLVVADERIVVAATRLGRGRLVVSQGALGALDRDELEAGLAHELAHIRRRHRPLLLLAAVLGATGRLLPGTRTAEAGVTLSLERDADRYAVRRTRDPLALASAICKAAGTTRSPGLAPLGQAGTVSTRLRCLVDDENRGSVGLDFGSRLLALVMVALLLVLAASVPSWAFGREAPAHSHAKACHHG